MKLPNYSNTSHRLLALTLAASCAIGVLSAGAQNYSVTDLGVLPDQEHSEATAINSNAQVAGTSGTAAFRYTETAKEKLENVSKYTKGTSRGFGINDSGLVVGDSDFGGDVKHAAVFSNGSATDLGTLKGYPVSRANDVNSFNQVVGFATATTDLSNGRAFITTTSNGTGMTDSRTGMTDLGTLGGAYAQAWAINDSGFVTGNSQLKSDIGATHAFLWNGRGMRDLGTLGGDFSYGTSINASNHVVGYSTLDKSNGAIHAFLYDGTIMRDLGSLGVSRDLDYSYALGVNSSDQVVGYTYLASYELTDPALATTETPTGPWPVAFVYRKGQMLNLNDLIGASSKEYRLDRATAINDGGQIVAVAFVNSVGAFHAVLLTPITKPAFDTVDSSAALSR
jgi:probable HAF family extracellular repeat protein